MSYLLNQLQGDLAPLFSYYEIGLKALEFEAMTTVGEPFAALDHEAQDAILTCIEKSETASPWPIDPAQFFQYLVTHVSEGYYADPGNGANLDKASWRMIGFPDRTGLEAS